MTRVSSRADVAFQFLITNSMVSGILWSRKLSSTNLSAGFRSVLRDHSFADETDMRTVSQTSEHMWNKSSRSVCGLEINGYELCR